MRRQIPFLRMLIVEMLYLKKRKSMIELTESAVQKVGYLPLGTMFLMLPTLLSIPGLILLFSSAVLYFMPFNPSFAMLCLILGIVLLLAGFIINFVIEKILSKIVAHKMSHRNPDLVDEVGQVISPITQQLRWEFTNLSQEFERK